jgi:resuscitation-promoting factor RpfB
VPGRINGFSLAYTAVGGVVLWSGIKGETISATFRGLLSGQAPSANTEQISTSTALQSDVDTGTSIPGVTVGIPAGVAAGGTPTANKALGLLMAGAYGWAGSGEWPYLESGWEEESGWSQYAAYDPSDPYNSAYGIPQANPGTKMASAGSDWKTNPKTQISWGLSYIKATYGSPSQVPGWTPNGPAAGYVGY